MGGEKVFRPWKGKRKMTLQCPAELLPELQRQFEEQQDEKLAAGDDWEDWDLVFCQPNGRPLDRTEDWKAWKALLAKAGVHDGACMTHVTPPGRSWRSRGCTSG